MITDILKEICFGYDGLIRSIHFKPLKSAIVEISTRRDPEGEWVNVEFIMKDVLEFCLNKPLICGMWALDLSLGISYKMIDGINYIDFSTDDTDEVDKFRRSEIYFACKSIECKIIPYRGFDKDGNYEPAPSELRNSGMRFLE
jgi:hypothetical protein